MGAGNSGNWSLAMKGLEGARGEAMKVIAEGGMVTEGEWCHYWLSRLSREAGNKASRRDAM